MNPELLNRIQSLLGQFIVAYHHANPGRDAETVFNKYVSFLAMPMERILEKVMWRKQKGEFIELGGPSIEEYDLPPKDIPRNVLPQEFGFKKDKEYQLVRHSYKLKYKGYEIDINELINNLPKEY